MATTELESAARHAVLERVRTLIPRLPQDGAPVVGIRSPEPPTWTGPDEVDLDGRPVRIAVCPSVLAVLDALAAQRDGCVLVLLTDRPETELGDAVLARLHRGRLLEADRYTLLDDLLGTYGLDPRIRADAWLVDALIELSLAKALPPTTGAVLSRPRALGLVAAARLGRDPEQTDLPGIVEIFDDPAAQRRWRALPATERAGLSDHLAAVHGRAARMVADLAVRRDDVLADLLVAQAIAAVPPSDRNSAVAFGRFVQSRFDGGGPDRADLVAAGAAAVEYATAHDTARVRQQIRRADELLDQLHAGDAAIHSPVLPRGYAERLARAAEDLTDETLAEVANHREHVHQPHRYDRLLAALRLRRWLATDPRPDLETAADGLVRHARELAWVDRALAQVRAGDADPRVQRVLAQSARQAGAARAAFDTAFAARLAAAPETPEHVLAVETLLPTAVAPLARTHRVLLVVVDGMSGAVANELAERLTDRTGWEEIVRPADGGREAVLAALPTETAYSRASLLRAGLAAGTATDERAAFAAHRFWPAGGAVLVHKAGIAGRDGADLGPELEQALGSDGPPVVGVVLNAVDDSLSAGRQGRDPGWRPGDVTGLPQVLERAAEAGRIVVLTSDHGHVLEHGSDLRSDASGGARWRAAGDRPRPDEVLVAGPRVLTPEGRAVLAVSEKVRYGPKAHGYHGGAALAEVAIPIVVLLPPGVDLPGGWHRHAMPAPAWWTGTGPAPTPAVDRPGPVRRGPLRKKTPAPQSEALFDVAPAPEPGPSRGAQLVASASFRSVHAALPANRVPGPETFAAVVDALVDAGGRLPVASLLDAAGSRGRNPRGVVATLQRVLNRDSFPVLTLVDGDRAVVLDRNLLDEQFPADGP